MGQELVSGSSPLEEAEPQEGSASSFSLSKYFELHLPFYLSIGMTPDEYWNGDACLVRYYREAHRLKQERENERLWLQGAYFYEALCDVAPVLHAFAKGDVKPHEYRDKPFPLTKEAAENQRLERERKQYEKLRAQAMANFQKINSNFKEKEGGAESDGNSN